MKYYVTNNIHIVEIPVEDFSIVMNDSKKKTAAAKNFANAGFFATYKEGGATFTLPVGHIICDFKASNQYVKKYCQDRGKFLTTTKYQLDSGKWRQGNSFYNKALSTLIVKDNKASIIDLTTLPTGCDYAISGIPIMNNGADIKFNPYVKNQGWSGGELYGTWHTFIGLKADGKIIYLMGMKTISGNMITSAEAFKKFKALNMYDVIKLDGGGSFHMNVNGKAVASTAENRLINSIICWKDNANNTIQKEENPYPVPTVTLKQGNKNTLFNKWLQWQLNMLGFPCSIDGSFGPATLKQVLNFQKSRKLDQDGSVGPATRKALIG